MPVPANSSAINKRAHEALFSHDPVMKGLVAGVELPPLRSTDNVFHDVMSCIIEQQIHYRSSKHSFQHLMQEAGLKELSIDNFHLLEPCLPKVRLSAAKVEAMAHTLDFFAQNDVMWKQLSDEEVRLELGRIKGVGRWTVDMILLYTLGRPDIFPHDDYHLCQIMPRLYGLDPKKKLAERMMAIAEQWSGFRSLAVLYLLAWKNQQLKKRKR